mgnify:CR=1 FL=1
MLEEQGLNEEAELVSTDMDVAEIDSLLKEWEEKLESQDLSETYARKRIIKKQEVSLFEELGDGFMVTMIRKPTKPTNQLNYINGNSDDVGVENNLFLSI